MATQPERIASLEASAAMAKWVLGIFVPLVIAWGTYITINVIAIKQSLQDSGSAKLVTELKSPSSPQQLRATLSTVIAHIETARAEGAKPNPKKIANLSSAITQVVQQNPQLPQAWQAAAALISYRNPTKNTTNLPRCDAPASIGGVGLGDHFDPSGPVIPVLVYKNCEIDLGDSQAYEEGSVSQSTRELFKKNVAFSFVLDHVHVIYRGGPIIPGLSFTFIDCSFDFDVNEAPPTAGKSLMTTLIASDASQIEVRIPGA